MSDSSVLDKDLARVIDLLEQIREVNKMIDLHKNESGDALMASQYEDIKLRFLNELKEILSEFQIEVIVNDQAA